MPPAAAAPAPPPPTQRTPRPAQHHPDLAITSYRDVTITLFTHALGGLSINDFILAARLDRVPITYSPKWLQQHPDTTAGVGAASAP